MAKTELTPSQHIDARIRDLDDWRGELLGRLRGLIHEVLPDVVEEWKWRGVPVWYHNGMVVTGETYKAVVKMTFAKGAELADPAKLFNSSLDGNVRRAIDFHEGEKINEKALKALFRDAAALNQAKPAKAAKPAAAKPAAAKAAKPKPAAAKKPAAKKPAAKKPAAKKPAAKKPAAKSAKR